MRTFAFLAALAGAILILPGAANAGVMPAWFQPQQQVCHYTGHYDQFGRLHTDGQVCTGGGGYQQPYPPRPVWNGGGYWREPPHHFVCFDQLGPGWQRHRVCI